MLSFVETMVSEFHMTPAQAFHHTGTALGFALIEARATRMGLAKVDYIDRAMIAAGVRRRRELEKHYTIQG